MSAEEIPLAPDQPAGLRVVFDCRYTRLERHDGISRYTAEIVNELGRIADVTMLISDERQLAMLPDLPWVSANPPTSLTEPFLPRFVNGIRPDVVFSPMQTMGSVGRRYPLVVTLHDLIYYRSPTPPRDLPWWVRIGWRMYHWSFVPVRLLLNRADAVVTVSETTRDLMVAKRLTRRPITVVRNGVRASNGGRGESAGAQGSTARRRPTQRSLVYMGSYMPYKNVETIARALHHLPGYTAQLLSRATPAEQHRLEALAPPGTLVFHGGTSDDEYQRILSGATALVTASRDEGFGIPLVEAMAAGTPIVVAEIPVFREIGGATALYFDPNNPKELADAVLRLDVDGEWERRSAESRQRAALFSWEESARTLRALLTEVATSSRSAPRT